MDKSKYEFVEYISPNEVKVKCKKCGNIRHTTPSNIYRYNCKVCAMKDSGLSKRKTLEEFINQAKEVHGDKYNYSEVEYNTDKDPIIIICPEHGRFAQIPSKHLQGHGCPKCVGREWTTDDFIRESKKIHGDKYDYSKVNFKLKKETVTIVCPIHGEFE